MRCPRSEAGSGRGPLLLGYPSLCLSLWAYALCVSVLLGGCATAPRHRTIVDLTYAFSEDTIYWPKNQSFQWEKTAWGPTEKGYWYASANYGGSEHGGTHMDAPIHFAEGRSTLDQIPVERLVGPAVVIDVRAQCRADRDYTLSGEDLVAWEATHGRIEAGDLVFMYTGWGERWPHRERYLGSAASDDASDLHFPGYSAEAAEFLVTKRAVRGVGIDTASIDPGQSQDFPAHQIVSQADVYALENVAALEKLPARGAMVFALPMKIKGGTGGPVRIIALVP